MRQVLQTKNWIYYLFLLVFTGLVSFACVAWFERLNTDAGYYFFKTINKGNFHIEHGRYVLALAETLPLIASKFQLPLTIVAFAYSINHVLFFIIGAFVCYKISKDTKGVLLITVIAFCGLNESVITPQFELYYGLVCIVMALSVYNAQFSSHASALHWPLIFIFSFLAITSHPMSLLMFIFILLLNELMNRRFFYPLYIGIITLAVFYYFWKTKHLSSYESGKFAEYLQAIKDNRVANLFQPPQLQIGIKALFFNYPDVLLLYVTGMVYFIRNKTFIAFLIWLLGTLFFLLSGWIFFAPSIEIGRYVEQLYYPFIFASICWIYWQKLPPIPLIILLSFSLVFRSNCILNTYKKYHARTEKMDYLIQIANAEGGNRFYVTELEMGKEQYNLGDWSYGFETLLRSSITSNKSISITKDEDLFFQKNDSLLRKSEYLFRMWEREPVSSLNAVYFKLDSGVYRRLYAEKQTPNMQ